MATRRKTGNDYRKEYEELKRSQESLDVHVTKRLLELGKIHPDAVVNKIGDTEIKATCLTKQWVESLKIDERIDVIEIIERWSSEKEKHIQLKI
jgi:hypothetical protein